MAKRSAFPPTRGCGDSHRAAPGTGLAILILCTLTALGGCVTGYGMAGLIGGEVEDIAR